MKEVGDTSASLPPYRQTDGGQDMQKEEELTVNFAPLYAN